MVPRLAILHAMPGDSPRIPGMVNLCPSLAYEIFRQPIKLTTSTHGPLLNQVLSEIISQPKPSYCMIFTVTPSLLQFSLWLTVIFLWDIALVRR